MPFGPWRAMPHAFHAERHVGQSQSRGRQEPAQEGGYFELVPRHPRRYATRTYGGSHRPPYSRSTTFEPKRHRHPLGVQTNHDEHRPPSLRPDSPSKVCQAESTQAMPKSTLQARVGPKAPRASQLDAHRGEKPMTVIRSGSTQHSAAWLRTVSTARASSCNASG